MLRLGRLNMDNKVQRRRFLQASASIAALRLARAQRRARPVAKPPAKPPLSLSVRDFGATGDGKTKDTAAIQRTIDRCGVLGGGDVIVPAGDYFTGAIALRSNVTLRLEKDASITGSPDFADYPVSQVRWEGKWIPGRVALVYAIDASRIASGRPYFEFLSVPDLSAGLYVLAPGQPDLQQPHTEDEIYYVVRGAARITVGEEVRDVREGSIVFVAAGVPHRFHDIAEELVLLVAFGPAEASRAG